MNAVKLCDFELDVLRMLNGTGPAIPWGAALGAALECLGGSGFIQSTYNEDTRTLHYSITDRGRAALEATK